MVMVLHHGIAVAMMAKPPIIRAEQPLAPPDLTSGGRTFLRGGNSPPRRDLVFVVNPRGHFLCSEFNFLNELVSYILILVFFCY